MISKGVYMWKRFKTLSSFNLFRVKYYRLIFFLYKNIQGGVALTENSHQLSWQSTLTYFHSLYNFNYRIYSSLSHVYNYNYLFTIYSEKNLFLSSVLKSYWWDHVGK